MPLVDQYLGQGVKVWDDRDEKETSGFTYEDAIISPRTSAHMSDVEVIKETNNLAA